MRPTRTHRSHAVRVAAVATAVVAVAYLVVVVVLNGLVAYRLTSQADSRVSHLLAEATTPAFDIAGSAPPAAGADRDVDDAPVFVWQVAHDGVATALTPGAPSLPTRQWQSGPTGIDVGGSPFRLRAEPQGDGWLVAGESLAQLAHVRQALLLPEVVLGLLLAGVTFAGALVIGRRASAPLELAHRRQTEFTADASHELRTPLSVIEAEADLALSRPRSPEDYRDTLHRIRGECDRLRRIVEDLLWLARADSGPGATGEGGVVDAGAVARAGAERFEPVAEARGVTLEVDSPDQPAPVRVDPEWLSRLVGVLVDNACTYAAPGGQVAVRVLVAGNRVVLRVDDSGPGIPVEERSSIFDRFHRSTDRAGGTGLGLAIADSVVQASGGSWSVGESPWGGARMEVAWRRAHPARADGDPTAAPLTPGPGARPGGAPPRPPVGSDSH